LLQGELNATTIMDGKDTDIYNSYLTAKKYPSNKEFILDNFADLKQLLKKQLEGKKHKQALGHFGPK